MFTFGVYLQSAIDDRELSDPRGGKIVNLNSNNSQTNNLSTPYRGGDIVQTPFDAMGRETGYHWPLPYVNDASQDIAVKRILASVAANKVGTAGGTQQRWAPGISIGVGM